MWKKILLKQEIGPQDRYAMSSYLTFFETLHLLHMRGALDFELTDELFRNRFFSAVGHPAVAGATLLKDPNSFTNITALMHDWTRYIMANDIPTPVGYPNYLTLTATSRGFEPVDLGPDDLADLLELQAATLTMLQGSPVLRENSAAMFTACLTDPDHHVLGWRKDGRLVAAAILYDGGTSAESIRRYTTSDPEALAASINLKLVITRDGFTRANLSRSLILQLEQIAVGRGKDEILATIHPQNAASRALFGSLGYRQIGKASTGYGTRLIYRRALTAATADRQRSQTPWPSLRS
ncbi:GNAT family N-acetyltransferase [Gordonia phosphorivorans]|uniref:GNAT family N-acetyltransferase n=1 Tax=Gordonia phosphorivorans TaxID=1056982 RepID=A0ABV6HAG6_9ACTN